MTPTITLGQYCAGSPFVDDKDRIWILEVLNAILPGGYGKTLHDDRLDFGTVVLLQAYQEILKHGIFMPQQLRWTLLQFGAETRKRLNARTRSPEFRSIGVGDTCILSLLDRRWVQIVDGGAPFLIDLQTLDPNVSLPNRVIAHMTEIVSYNITRIAFQTWLHLFAGRFTEEELNAQPESSSAPAHG